mgnify:CR=1 FL=1
MVESSKQSKSDNASKSTIFASKSTIFFGRFAADHRAFGSWKDGFIRKQKKIKFEAQQRIRRDVGGLGKQFYTPPSEYSPPVQNLNLWARI